MIASIGPNLPHDVLVATGRFAGPLAVDTRRSTERASQWLESKFAPWTKMVVEAWADGDLDHLEAVVFSRAEDSSQRLYYYVCELQRRGLLSGPEAVIVDIAKIPRPSCEGRPTEAVRALCRRFDVGDDALEQAIRQTNERRRAMPQAPEGRRCLVAGTAAPDDRIHRIVEGCGFVAVAETLADEWGNIGPLVTEGTGDPAAAVGAQLHQFSIGPRSFADPAEELLSRMRAVNAQAVVVWRIEEDEAQAWHLPAQRRALEENGIPSLVMTRRDWLLRDGAADEIASFLTGIAA